MCLKLILAAFVFCPSLLFGQISCGEVNKKFTGVCIRNYADGTISDRLWYNEGEWTGKREHFRENGDLEYVISEIYPDQLTFRMQAYHENNSIRKYLILENGTGRAVEFYRNGEMKSDAYYQDSMASGVWSIYDSLGHLLHQRKAEDLNPRKCSLYEQVIVDVQNKIGSIEKEYKDSLRQMDEGKLIAIPAYLVNHDWKIGFDGMCLTSDDASALRIDTIGDTLIGVLREDVIRNGSVHEATIYLQSIGRIRGDNLPFTAWSVIGDEILAVEGVLSLDFENYVILNEKQFEKMDCN